MRGKSRPGQPLLFTARATDADGDPLTYTWDFGDGETATGATVEHTYAAAGTYVAVVTVSDGADSVSDSVTVTLKGKGKVRG